MLDPRPPATLTISDSGRVALLNFGDGSGQVYSLEAYDLRANSRIDVSPFMARVHAFGLRQPGCRVRMDEISIFVSSWASGEQVEIRTEDWSRTEHCEALNRDWVLQFPEGGRR